MFGILILVLAVVALLWHRESLIPWLLRGAWWCLRTILVGIGTITVWLVLLVGRPRYPQAVLVGLAAGIIIAHAARVLPSGWVIALLVVLWVGAWLPVLGYLAWLRRRGFALAVVPVARLGALPDTAPTALLPVAWAPVPVPQPWRPCRTCGSADLEPREAQVFRKGGGELVDGVATVTICRGCGAVAYDAGSALAVPSRCPKQLAHLS